MVLHNRCKDMDESMSQIVPSAGFTPPCDYSNFADTFDLSLLPGGDCSTNLYTQSPPPPKIFTTYLPEEKDDIDLGPDFQKLLAPIKTPASPDSGIYLEVPTSKNYHPNSPIGALAPYSPQLLSPNEYGYYPSSPELSLYNNSPYTPEEYIPNAYIKKENTYTNLDESKEIQIDEQNVFELLGNTLLDKQIKQESTVDFGTLLQPYSPIDKKPKSEDHQLLREVLRDTSFQKKYNIKPFDFGFDIKMEEPDENLQKDICSEQLARENIEPVLNLAIEQMRKDVDTTCTALGISPDPSQWTQANVLSWLEWTSREFNIPAPVAEQWEIAGTSLVCLSEDDFIRRSPQGGATLYAQLEIWKAAFLDDDLSMHWLPETTSNASSGDVSDEEDEEMHLPQSEPKPAAPATPRPTGGSHIHLWQFLKELLASPQIHGSCIRWIDRTKGVFKIEDSVKVARLWGKRKNRPAMNYDKLSRSIRQYYKKGIMKKTERSQRLVYQFCHPYCL